MFFIHHWCLLKALHGGATRQQWQISHSHWPTISLTDSSQRVRREKLGLVPL